MLTVAEVASRLRVSCSTVYSLIEAGHLRCYRIGLKRGTIRVTEDQLKVFLTSVEVTPTSSSAPELRHIRVLS